MLVHFGPDAAESDQRGTPYERWETRSADDGCAMVDYYYYCYLLLFTEKNHLPGQKRCILGGALVAFGAGELVQQMLLANTSGLGISAIFDKVYPCSVDARINQKLVVDH